jgi:hypothetical protein
MWGLQGRPWQWPNPILGRWPFIASMAVVREVALYYEHGGCLLGRWPCITTMAVIREVALYYDHGGY